MRNVLAIVAPIVLLIAASAHADTVTNPITQDTYYNGASGGGAPAGGHIQAGLTPRVGMFRLDLAGVAGGITGVRLNLVASGGIVAGSVVELFAVNQAWDVAAATYSTSDGTNAWLTPFAATAGLITAGPFDATSLASYTVPADLAVGGPVVLDLNPAGVAVAEGWRTGANNGLVFALTSGGSGNNGLWVAASENATAAYRPSATITYVPEPASLSLLGLGALALLRRRR